MRPTLPAIALAALATAATACATAPEETAMNELPASGRILVGPTFWPARDDGVTYRAVVVDDAGVVRALLPQVPPIPPGLDVVRLPGALAVPGLADAHLHLAWIGRSFETLSLAEARSPEQVRAQVKTYAAAHPDVALIAGDGWDQNQFPDRAFPTAEELGGAAGDRPVVLTRVDGHALWLNEAALALVASMLDEPGAAGRVVRDVLERPTGVVVDPSDALREALKVPPTVADHTRWIRAGLTSCADAGLVEVHFMAATVPELEALIGIAEADGRLPVRVVVYLYAGDEAFAWLDAHPPGPVTPHPDVSVVGVKVFADGALGSRGAALKAPYSDATGERGASIAIDQLRGWARRATSRGLQVAIHAIGDRATSAALQVIADAGGPPGLRHRIEHAQIVDPADWSRFEALGVVASMQPTHATSDMRWVAERLGQDRLAGAYAWRTVLERGIPLAFGSDGPIETWRPAVGIYAATTRQDAAGWPERGWRPEERLTVAQAVRAYSSGASFAAHQEDRHGSLAVGRPLDLTLFDADPRREPARWLRATPTATVRDGVIRRITRP